MATAFYSLSQPSAVVTLEKRHEISFASYIFLLNEGLAIMNSGQSGSEREQALSGDCAGD